MKTLVTISLSLGMALFQPVSMKAGLPSADNQLTKEIEGIVKNHTHHFMAADTEEVTVHFQINAQNEVVIFDTTGESDAVCAHVKEALNYRQVRYKKAKPLTPYKIKIRFINKAD